MTESTTIQIDESMIHHAAEIAEEIDATAVLVYVDVVKSPEKLKLLSRKLRCIYAARSADVVNQLEKIECADDRIIVVPYMNLSRSSQIKVAAMLAFSNGFITTGDRLVCLAGSPKFGILDSIT